LTDLRPGPLSSGSAALVSVYGPISVLGMIVDIE
jgi:hypothetical protein